MGIRDAVKWFQNHLGFINRLPSWLNELLSGVLAVGLAVLALFLLGLLFHTALLIWTFPLAFVFSEGYEHLADPWGYNPQDVVERVRGIVLVMVAWRILQCLLI